MVTRGAYPYIPTIGLKSLYKQTMYDVNVCISLNVHFITGRSLNQTYIFLSFNEKAMIIALKIVFSTILT